MFSTFQWKETSTQVSTGLGSVHPGPHVTSRQVPRKPPCPQSPPCLRRVTTVPAASGTAQPLPFPNLPQTDSHRAHTHRHVCLPGAGPRGRRERCLPAGPPRGSSIPVPAATWMVSSAGLLPSVLRASRTGFPGREQAARLVRIRPDVGLLGSGSTTPPSCCPPPRRRGGGPVPQRHQHRAFFTAPFNRAGDAGAGGRARSSALGSGGWCRRARSVVFYSAPTVLQERARVSGPLRFGGAFSHPFTALRSFCLYVAWLGRASETRVPTPTHAHVLTRHVRAASPSSVVFPSPEGVF